MTYKPRFFYIIPAEATIRFDGESHLTYWHRRVFRKHKQLPSGGVKVIYQQCEILRDNGYEAHVIHLGEFTIDWFSHNIQPLSAQESLSIIRSDDVLICPEIMPSAASQFNCRHKFAFVQAWSLVDIGTGAGRRYEDFGFTGILCCSEFIREFMKEKSELPSHVITNGIDLNLFRPDASRRKPGTVLYLNRRHVNEARLAIKKLDMKTRKENEFIELANKYTQSQIIEFYKQADIFMAIGYPEGFGLPPLEAMACGCAVIGYTGQGGKVHMHQGRTALIAEDGNIEELSNCLHTILTDKELKEDLREEGRKMAQNFPITLMSDDLLNFAASFKKSII
ncbi:MAG: glycosyltransferase family 4 protein [Nitrospira sp.]|nr:glycosyltransferase family 4 protein [bacterium]MBL7047952.1 glycosyltransferase family 4 protein [Nitrospira sp.]